MMMMMNSNLQPEVDAHQISLDLDGLEELLNGAEEFPVIEAEQAPPPLASETELIFRLLDQVRILNDHVDQAKERVISANDRMSSLVTMIEMQSSQLERMTHFQIRAGKVQGLERKLELLERENERLRGAWWRKLLFWAKK